LITMLNLLVGLCLTYLLAWYLLSRLAPDVNVPFKPTVILVTLLILWWFGPGTLLSLIKSSLAASMGLGSNLAINDSCSVGWQCNGYTGVGTEGNACCQGKCQALKQDYLGTWWCPHECRGALGRPGGTCDKVPLGGQCSFAEQCEGFTVGGSRGNHCCQGKCRARKQDHLGIWWCPHECASAVTCPGGTCDKVPLGGQCRCPEQCEGFTIGGSRGNHCCQGKCQARKHDYLGIWWCPHECKNGIFAPSGTC